MSAILPVNFDVRSAQVLDKRCAGLAADNNGITFKAPGLLRYETDNDAWKYWDGTSFVSLAETYTQGTGVSINGSNEISIGQPVGTTDNVEFNFVQTSSISNSGALTNTGNITISTGSRLYMTGDIENNTGNLNINNVFATSYTGSNLHITTNRFNPSATKLKLTEFGEILAGGSSQDSGTDGAVLISKGVGNPVEWRPRVVASAYLTSNVGYPTLVRAAMTDMKPLSIEIDLGSGSYGYNNVTGIYTIPYDGVYRVVYQVGFLDNDGYGPNGMNACSLELLKNTGGGFTREYNSTSKSSNEFEDNRLMANLSAVMDFSQGDQLLCRASYFSTTNNTVMIGGNSPRYCFQSIELIG